MPNFNYTTKQAVTLATRKAACERVATIFLHLDGFAINFVALVTNGDNTLTLTVSKAIPLDHLDLFDIVAS